MSEFYMIIARKIFFPIFFGGGRSRGGQASNMLIVNFTNTIMFQCVIVGKCPHMGYRLVMLPMTSRDPVTS